MLNKIKKYFITIGIVAIIAFVGLFVLVPEFSGFASSLVKITIGAGLFFLFDQYVLKDLDTIEELKKGNVAYAIFMLGYAVLLAAAIASE